MANAIGTIGNIPTLTIGGRLFTDLTTIIPLYTHVTSGGNRFGTFRKMGAGTGAGYQVTAGKTMIVYASQMANDAAALETASYAQTDADVGLDSATALTNPVYFGSESTTFRAVLGSTTSAAGSVVNLALSGKVAATKYCTANGANVSNASHLAWAYET